jgi:hypothetical protein
LALCGRAFCGVYRRSRFNEWNNHKERSAFHEHNEHHGIADTSGQKLAFDVGQRFYLIANLDFFCLQSLIDVIEADDTQIRIKGSKAFSSAPC